MGVDRTFAAAYIDNGVQHKLFGRRLRPFSLWHLLLLQVIESPFVTQKEIALHDLKNAIAICTLKYRNSKIHRPFFPIRTSRKKLTESVSKFILYIGDYMSRPEYTIIPWNANEPQYPGLPLTDAPATVITAFNACAATKLPITKIWDLPIGESYVAEAMHLRMQGNRMSFMDEDERKFQRDIIEAEKAREAA